MRKQLFRTEALEARRSTIVGSVLATRRLSFWAMTAAAATFALGLAALCAWGEYTRKVHVGGYLAPSAGLIKVYAGQVGSLTTKHVVEGQAVKRGDVLYLLSTERGSARTPEVQAAATAVIQQRQQSLAREYEAQRQVAELQLAASRTRLGGMQDELAQLRGTAAAQLQRVASARETLVQYERLSSDGYVAAAMVQQRRDDVLDQTHRWSEMMRSQAALQRDIVTLQQEIAAAALKQASERSRQEREQAQLGQDAVESDLRRAMAITAPADGVATAVLGEVGQATQPQSLLLTILPAGSVLQARLLVPSRAIGLLAVGDRVALRYPAFPYQRFGSFVGRVVEIPRAMITAAEAESPVAQGEPAYRVTVSLETQQVQTSRAAFPLQNGMSLEADIWLDKRRLYEWLFEPLLDLGART